MRRTGPARRAPSPPSPSSPCSIPPSNGGRPPRGLPSPGPLFLEELLVGRVRLVAGGARLALRAPEVFRGALLVVAGDAQRLVPGRGQRRVAGAVRIVAGRALA